MKIYPHIILSFRNIKGDILQNDHAALFHILKTWPLTVKHLKGQKRFIKVVRTTCALYSKSDMFGRSWGWVNDDEPVIFLRKKLCFGLMKFPKTQHLAKTQHFLQYYGLREPPVWYSLKCLQTIFSPSHFPYEHLWCSWDVLWYMRHVFISKKYSHDLFSDHKQLIC